ncbi:MULTISPECIES: OmpH family outer membrane protein [Thiorhodovibrio]|jgi:outer membrane protein|uniref:OmpH family outer membrane protein n=1 Tax=Thiorhodovibrio TaxID=61593 RepID=UPI001A924F17|nr:MULTISPECIES: OmpH family outer membrane protein [Thiorhodovibrio]WPL11380.1 Cationic 19 kDa outer membrane protein [Thiorhodovibrio litoralis]
MTRQKAAFYLGCLLCLPLLGLGAAQAADTGYVNMQRVLKESQLGVDAEKRLQERFGPKTEPFAEEEMAIRQLQQGLERDKALMSEAQVEKKETEVRERIQAFEKDFTAVQRELMEAQQEEAKKILEPAGEALKSIAEKKKLSAVFEASQQGILYLDPKTDLTDEVIELMDKKK